MADIGSNKWGSTSKCNPDAPGFRIQRDALRILYCAHRILNVKPYTLASFQRPFLKIQMAAMAIPDSANTMLEYTPVCPQPS